MVSETSKLKKTIGFGGLLAIAMVSLYPAGIIMSAGAGLVVYAGLAAPLVMVISALLILFFTIPIFEYSRMAAFNGGYYGLSELGLGRAFGKYTATVNLTYLLFWNIVGPAAVSYGWFTFAYYLFHYQMPPVIYVLIGIGTLILIFVATVVEVKYSIRTFIIAAIIQVALIVSVAIYIVIKAPYNSTLPFQVSSAPAGINSVMLGVIVSGFLLYTMYGLPLFFGEEGKSSYKDSWKAIAAAVVITTAIGIFGTYSEIATVNPANSSILTSVWNPAAIFYTHYIGFYGILIYLILANSFLLFSVMATGMSAARMMFSMSRDKFIKSKWLGKIDEKRGTPINGAIVNLIVGIVLLVVFESIMFHFYGAFMGAVYSLFLSGSMGVAFWFFHHVVPDISFPFFLRKYHIKILSARYFASAILAPAGAIALFVLALYYGYSSLPEPYLAGFITVIVVLVGLVGFVIYKWKKGELGESYVTNTVKLDLRDSEKTKSESIAVTK